MVMIERPRFRSFCTSFALFHVIGFVLRMTLSVIVIDIAGTFLSR